jgi:predicted Fe-Mo cluster-binding NifX family protein
MKIAVTVWNGRIAPLFDVSGTLRLFSIEEGVAVQISEVSVPAESGVLQRTLLMAGHRVSVLICGAVSNQVHRLLTSSGIEVHSFVSGDVEEVLQAFLDGKLDQKSFSMPGCGMGRGEMGCRRNAGFKGRNRGSCSRKKEV